MSSGFMFLTTGCSELGDEIPPSLKAELSRNRLSDNQISTNYSDS